VREGAKPAFVSDGSNDPPDRRGVPQVACNPDRGTTRIAQRVGGGIEGRRVEIDEDGPTREAREGSRTRLPDPRSGSRDDPGSVAHATP